MTDPCQAYADRLIEHAWDDLPAVDAREVELHAASCRACGAELGSIRALRRMVERLAHETPPQGGEHVLSAAAREVARGEEAPRQPLRERRSFPVVPTWGLRALAVIAAVAIVGASLAWILSIQR